MEESSDTVNAQNWAWCVKWCNGPAARLTAYRIDRERYWGEKSDLKLRWERMKTRSILSAILGRGGIALENSALDQCFNTIGLRLQHLPKATVNKSEGITSCDPQSFVPDREEQSSGWIENLF